MTRPRPSRPPSDTPRSPMVPRPPARPPGRRTGRTGRVFELLHKLLTGGAALATLLRLLFF